MSDFMEIGDGLIPIENGWFLERETGNKISPDGCVFDHTGEKIWDPELDEDYEQ